MAAAGFLSPYLSGPLPCLTKKKKKKNPPARAHNVTAYFTFEFVSATYVSCNKLLHMLLGRMF